VVWTGLRLRLSGWGLVDGPLPPRRPFRPARQSGGGFHLALVIGVLVGEGSVIFFSMTLICSCISRSFCSACGRAAWPATAVFSASSLRSGGSPGEAVFRCCTSLTSRPRRFPPVCCSAGWPISSTASSGEILHGVVGGHFSQERSGRNAAGAYCPRHPSQLYEAALEGVLLLAFMQWRVWKSSVLRTQPGRLCGEYMVGYAAVRIFCEVFREPDAGSRSSSA